MKGIFVPQVAVIDFNHHRGPEIEFWVDPEAAKKFSSNEWSQLPFLALPDGAHASTEEFSYFTLLSHGTQDEQGSKTPDTSQFGISCTRQIRAEKLKAKSSEVTRSTVQKAVVVIVDKPGVLGQLRERLAAVTSAWFAQEDFTSIDILKEFQESLAQAGSVKDDDREPYFGMSLRELIYELRYQSLILFKCLLLRKRILFFSTRCERQCMTQFALISLIPSLLQHLEDCADPTLDSYSRTVTRAVNLRTSERSSLLAYMGLPLQIFGKDAFFSPYTPLQQLDLLNSDTSRSYVAGTTNTLLLSQQDLAKHNEGTNTRYCDVLVNLDEPAVSSKVTILDPSLRGPLALSAADRRWIDNLIQTVIDTWNPSDPSRPTTHGYAGSEDSIRLLFEEYILSLLSSVAYKNHLDTNPNPHLGTGSGTEDHHYSDPVETAADFNIEFLKLWRESSNYKLWADLTKETTGIFDLVEPRHPTAGGLNIEDVQRRVGAAVAELNLDERVRQGRETAGKAFEAGRERVGLGVARFWKEVESFKERREQGRSRNEASESNDGKNNEKTTTSPSGPGAGAVTEKSTHNTGNDTSTTTATPVTATNTGPGGWVSNIRDRAIKAQSGFQKPQVDTTQIQAAARENAAKAGAYLSSWGSWARERQKEWSEARQNEGKSREIEGADSSGAAGKSTQSAELSSKTATPDAVAAAQTAMGFGAGSNLKGTGSSESDK